MVFDTEPAAQCPHVGRVSVAVPFRRFRTASSWGFCRIGVLSPEVCVGCLPLADPNEDGESLEERIDRIIEENRELLDASHE